MIYYYFDDLGEDQVSDYKNPYRQKKMEWAQLSTEMLPDYTPDPFHFSLARNLPLTDILSFFRSSGFFFNEKVKKIVETLVLTPHCIFPAQMKYRGKFYEYYFLHIKFSEIDFLDFPNTILGVRGETDVSQIPSKQTFLDIELPRVNNLEEFQTMVSETRGRYPKGVGLKDECYRFDQPYDILNINAKFFISDKFLSLLKEHQITGYQVKPNTFFRHNFV